MELPVQFTSADTLEAKKDVSHFDFHQSIFLCSNIEFKMFSDGGGYGR